MASAGKHVLFVVENLSVPFDRRVFREARALHSRGCQVSVICPRGVGYDTEPFAEIDGVRIHRYRLPFEGVSSATRFTIGLFVLEYAWALAATLALAAQIYVRRRFHVIHAANPPDLFFLIALCFKPFGVRFVWDVHDLNPEGLLAKRAVPRKGGLYHVLVLAEKASARLADMVVVTNDSYARILRARHGLERTVVVVVRNGPDLAMFKPKVPDPDLRGSYHYVAAYIGVMGKLDGLDYLLRAASHVVHARKRSDVLFVLMGSGTAVPELQAQAEALALDGAVRFTGRVPDLEVVRVLSAADVCLAPDPKNEMNDHSTMNKIMDYMAFGKPIVSFDLVESRYSAQEAAVYVADNDALAFGDAIVALLDDPAARARMGAAGLARVPELAWGRSEEVLAQAYHSMLGSAQ
ncbi:MAG: glycosyltransferase family 4 protein [Gemmatimonadaceae bacterium]